MRRVFDPGSVIHDVPRLGEGGFLETESLADVDVMRPRGIRLASGNQMSRVDTRGSGLHIPQNPMLDMFRPYRYGKSRLSSRPT